MGCVVCYNQKSMKLDIGEAERKDLPARMESAGRDTLINPFYF